MRAAAAALLLLLAGGAAAQTGRPEPRPGAIALFFVFVAVTLGITWWAARRMRSRSDFYAAGQRITGFQNGLALTGDFLSAATFLGISALAFVAGFDALIFCIGGTLGWIVVLFLVAERLRNLGRYTFADVAAYRLERAPIRALSAAGTLAVAVPYLIAQIVGAGALIQSLFGIDYTFAVVTVGVLMTLYVSFGGMIATTWVQIIKAVLLLTGGTILGLGVLALYQFDLGALAAAAVAEHPRGAAIMSPGVLYRDPVTVVSIAISFICGTAGLPHVLMRFFTVPDALQARRSVAYATGFIGFFMALIFVIGLGAVALLSGDGRFVGDDGQLVGGANMATIHLAQVIGGDFFLAFISAVTFATILAVVSGITLSAASAVSHDLYANVFRHGRSTEAGELAVSRTTTVVIGVLTIGLGLIFEGENVAVLATIAMVFAGSVNFPVLFLAMYWRGITTRGAVRGGLIGLATAAILVILSPTVWVGVLGYETAPFPFAFPTLFSVPAAFLGVWLFSTLDRSAQADAEAQAFDAQFIRSEIGPLAAD